MPNLSTDTFDQLIAALFAGPFEADYWQSFFELLCASTQADYAVLCLSIPGPEYAGVSFTNAKGSFEERYSYGAVAKENPLNALPDCTPTTLHEFIGDKALVNNDYYQNFLKPRGYIHVLGMNIFHNDEVAINVRTIRGEKSRDFTDKDKAVLLRLAPHFRNLVLWLENREQLQSEKSIYEDVVSQLALGIIHVRSDGRIEKKNPIAEYLIEEDNGLSVINDRLHCRNREINQQLKSLLTPSPGASASAGNVPQSLSIPRVQIGKPIYLVVRPQIPSELSSDPLMAHTIVFLNAPELHSIGSADKLRPMLGLTKTETKIAIELANGLSANEIAEKLNISVNTIRTHIARTFRKTGVNRQSELTNLVLRCIASLPQ